MRTRKEIEGNFIRTVQTRGILPKGSKIWAAVSGGSDSVALLRLLKQFAHHMDWDIAVLHIDHGTRPDSADDAIFVEELTDEMGFFFQLGRISPPGTGSPEGFFSGKRFEIYTDIAGDSGLVATGHTASDRAETLILRLLEGSGLRGLGGMDYRGRGPVRRPLLDFSRIDLQEYLEARGQDWIEDPTNSSDEYLRNRIRHNVMPMLESLSTGSVYAISRSSANLSQWRDVMDHLIESTIAEMVDGDTFLIERFLEHPKPLGMGILWVLCNRPRGGREEIEKADRWLRRSVDGSHPLPGGYLLELNGPAVRIVRIGK